MLAPFIKWLEERDMVNISLVAGDTDEGLDTQLRIQKYVFAAQHLGRDTEYEYNEYRAGPYSPDLTSEYYRLADHPASYEAESGEPMPGQFRTDDFLSTVSGRDDQWLEVAATLIDMSPQHKSAESLVNHVAWIKSAYSREYTEKVLEDLRRSPMRKDIGY